MYAIKCFVHIYLVNEGEDRQGSEPGGKPRKARGRPHTAALTVWLTVMFFFASVYFIAFLSVGFLTGDLSPEGGGATLNASSQQHIRLLAQHSTYRDPGKDGGATALSPPCG